MRTAKIDFMLKSVIFPLFICSLSLTVWADETIEIPPIPNTIKINESLKGVSADCLTTKEVPVNADDIKLCYKKHFLFIELLMMTSDSDFESVDKNTITMVATDGHRLSLIKKSFAGLSFNEKIEFVNH